MPQQLVQLCAKLLRGDRFASDGLLGKIANAHTWLTNEVGYLAPYVTAANVQLTIRSSPSNNLALPSGGHNARSLTSTRFAGTQVAAMLSSRRYGAFISYSHRVDRKLARFLRSDRKRFGGDWPWSRKLRVYGEETNRSATPDLWGNNEKALDQSESCSSRVVPIGAIGWGPRELDHFACQRGDEALCIVLTLGKTPYTDTGEIEPAERALSDSTLASFGDKHPWSWT